MDITSVKTKTGEIYYYQNGRRISKALATKQGIPTSPPKQQPAKGLSQEEISDLIGNTIKYCYVHPVTLKIEFLGFGTSFDTKDKKFTWDTLVFGPKVTNSLFLASNPETKTQEVVDVVIWDCRSKTFDSESKT